MAKTLPAELVDMTIDGLLDDRQALCACALVAKSWTPRTRVWLFRAIQVGHPVRNSTDSPCHPDLYPSSRFSRMSPERFAQYLRRAKSFVTYLRDLRLSLNGDFFSDTPSAWDYILSKIPTPFPVRRLYVNIEETDYVLLVLRSLRPHIASLETFSFMSCLTGTSSLTDILLIYPELRIIYPAPVCVDDDVRSPLLPARTLVPPATSNCAPPRLIIITLLSILPWASRHLRPCDRLFLEDANIEYHDYHQPDTDSSVAKSLVSGIKLSLEWRHSAVTIRFIESLPRIRVLQLTHRGFYNTITTPPYALDLLTDLHDACARLRALVLEFQLDFQQIGDLGRHYWASLDGPLSQPQWAHLHVLVSVRVNRVPEGSTHGCLRDTIAAGLPETSARGCLKIYYAESCGKTFPPPMDFSYLAAEV